MGDNYDGIGRRIDRMLGIMQSSRAVRTRAATGFTRTGDQYLDEKPFTCLVPLSAYRGACPFSIEADVLVTDDDAGRYLVPTDATLNDIGGSPNSAFAKEWRNDIIFAKLSLPHPSWSRGHHKLRNFPHMVCLTYSTASPVTGQHRSNRVFYGSLDGAEWQPAVVGLSDTDQDVVNIKLMLGHQWAQQMHWTAHFRLPGGPHLTFDTDQVGALALLKDRDPTASRRRALIHWVKNHFRRSRAGDVHEVRAHLRGAVSCEWHGLEICVEPSLDDREKLATDLGQIWKEGVTQWKRACIISDQPKKSRKKNRRQKVRRKN